MRSLCCRLGFSHYTCLFLESEGGRGRGGMLILFFVVCGSLCCRPGFHYICLFLESEGGRGRGGMLILFVVVHFVVGLVFTTLVCFLR